MNIVAVVRKSEVNRSGKTNIKIKISHRGESRYIATDYFIDPALFKPDGSVANQHENAAFINLQLKQIILNYEFKLINTDCKSWHINRVVQFLKGEKQETNNFQSYFGQVILQKAKKSKRTGEIYQATLTMIERFDTRRPLTFEDITAGWLRKFETWLLRDGGKQNSAAIHLRNIRAVFNEAIDDDVASIALYPFRRFKIRHSATKKRSLSIDQVRALAGYQSDSDFLLMVRDAWLLSFCLIGINTSDLWKMTRESIKNHRVNYDRSKTGGDYSVKLEPETVTIINRLRGKNSLLTFAERYNAPETMTTVLDKHLKKIGAAIGEPSLSMYWARHSWSTIAKNAAGAHSDDISAALGHTQKGVTQIYLKRDPAIVDRLNRAVLDLVFSR